MMAPAAVEGAIEVVEDEIIFTVVAPGAREVYLVGEFNNWNPTLEKMSRIGDTFESILFITPGVYHYKFVVDGEWVFDDGNKFRDDEGSLVALEDRGGVLVISTEDYLASLSPDKVLTPAIRYAGKVGVDDGDEVSDQDLDLYVYFKREFIRASANLKTVEDNWQWSPFESGLKFDRGMIAVDIGKLTMTTFENDTSWTSADPFNLLGQVGVFDYDAGYLRKGFKFELLDVARTNLRAAIMDKLDTFPERPLTLGPEAFGDFAGGTSADTTVYQFRDSHDDADTWALELHLDLDRFGLGYGTRNNTGMHDGLLAAVERAGPGFDVEAVTSREAWRASVFWGRWRFTDDFTARAGYGYSNAEQRATAESQASTAVLDQVSIRQYAEEFGGRTRFQHSKRAQGAIDYERKGVRVGLEYLWNRFDFQSPLYTDSEATIDDYRLSGGYTRGSWQTTGFIRYLDQRYGATPGEMHYFTSSRNFWLDYDDKLDAANMVVFDVPRSTTFGVDFELSPRRPFGWDEVLDSAPLMAYADAELVMEEFFGRMQHASVRAGLERGIYKRVYGQFDARVAHYDKSSWMVNETYFAPYLEIGYRHKHIELSLGYGQDPVVLDRFINMYYGNGRERRLIQAVPDGLTRDQADELGARLQAQEQLLDNDNTVKLELIVGF